MKREKMIEIDRRNERKKNFICFNDVSMKMKREKKKVDIKTFEIDK